MTNNTLVFNQDIAKYDGIKLRKLGLSKCAKRVKLGTIKEIICLYVWQVFIPQPPEPWFCF